MKLVDERFISYGNSSHVTNWWMFISYSASTSALDTSDQQGSIELVPSSESQDVSSGSNIVVTCKLSGRGFTSHRIWWTGPSDQRVPTRLNSNKRYYAEEPLDGTEVSLILEGVEQQDAGAYTCHATINGRTTTRSFLLHVHKTVEFTGTPQHQTLSVGAASSLRCTARGDPPPSVAWSVRGRRLNADSDKYVRAGHILHVYNVTRSDAGIYTCHSRQISPRMSHVDSFKINVTVLHPPQFTTANDSEHFGFVQGVANLSCSVDADPAANFTWYKDGQELRAKLIFEEKESDDYSWLLKTRQTLDRVSSIGHRHSRAAERPNGPLLQLHQVEQRHDRSKEHPTDDRYTVRQDGGTSYLQINITDESVFGRYECRAANALGSDSRTFSLKRGVQPPTPHIDTLAVYDQTLAVYDQTLAVYDQTLAVFDQLLTIYNQMLAVYDKTLTIVSQDSHNIALSLRVGDQVSDEGQHITGYAVLYKKGGDKSSLMHHFHKDGPFILTDLQPATVYVLQAASQNIAGMSPYSEQIVRRTDNLTTARVAAGSAGRVSHMMKGSAGRVSHMMKGSAGSYMMKGSAGSYMMKGRVDQSGRVPSLINNHF
ncbi:hemicentin-2-like [Hyalella azteca]|uniref:Hemicentin-2-like n=1 Tax=Hyalella azteca TaxID=294128 RepID=A0A979FNC2_HYAAZ|nr:hemicentin-2-like [Hyalella azteca]